MKKAIYYIFIISVFFGCKNKKGQPIGEESKVIQDTFQTEKKELRVQKVVTDKIKPINLDTIKAIQSAYVVAENGLSYRESPDVNSEKLGTFDFGTKLAIIQKTGVKAEIIDNAKKIKGQWVKVKSKIDRDDKKINFEKFDHLGYVFDGFLKDSATIDFTKSPVFPNEYFQNQSKVFVEPKESIKKLDLTFTEINQNKFKDFVSDYDDKIIVDSTKSVGYQKYFVLKTSKNLFKFSCDEDYGNCSYYEGFIEPIKMYGIKWCGNGYCSSSLLDSISGTFNSIPTRYDYPNEIPLLSKNETQLITFASSPISSQSYLSLFIINPETKKFEFNEYQTSEDFKGEIAELVWINEKEIALKTYEKTVLDKDENKEKYIGIKYFRVKLNG